MLIKASLANCLHERAGGGCRSLDVYKQLDGTTRSRVPFAVEHAVAYVLLTLMTESPSHVQSRIRHPRLNRLIFSGTGWSTCFISVLPAPLGASQLCSVL